MARRITVAALILLLQCLMTATLAQEWPTVVMTYPPRLRDNQPKILFEPVERVRFNWTSTFPRITLELYRGPRPDGHWAMYTLLPNVSNSTTFYDWDARVLPGMSRDDSFHLRLFNPNGADCNRCHSNSSLFEIRQDATTTSSSASDTPTSIPTSDASTSLTDSHAFKLGLGLGLGLGIPLVVLLTSLATWACVRRRKRRRIEESASQSGEPLVDWKGAQSHESAAEGHIDVKQEDMAQKAEVEGGNIVEMSGTSEPSEAPAGKVEVERAELEDSSRRS